MPTILNRQVPLSTLLLILHGIAVIVLLWYSQLTDERKRKPRTSDSIFAHFICTPTLISYPYFRPAYTNNLLQKRIAYVYQGLCVLAILLLRYWDVVIRKREFGPQRSDFLRGFGVEVVLLIVGFDGVVLGWVIEGEARREQAKGLRIGGCAGVGEEGDKKVKGVFDGAGGNSREDVETGGVE